MAQVRIEHLTKIFHGSNGAAICAVQEVDLSVEEEELLVLVGPSGCGKTTLLRLIAGLEEPTSGAISIDGRIVNKVEPRDRDVAMVFQSPALYPHLSVRDNMAFGLKLRKAPRSLIEERINEAVAILGLDGCLDRKPHEISGGQRQRVALGRAMVRRPKLFLLDEPLSNLDVPLRAQLRVEILNLHRRLSTTMIYVTHDPSEAATLGDRIAMMKEGRIEQIQRPFPGRW